MNNEYYRRQVEEGIVPYTESALGTWITLPDYDH